MAALQDIAQHRDEAVRASRALTDAVAAARARGVSWKRIADTLGQGPLGHFFPTGASTTAVRNYYVGRSSSAGDVIA